MISIFRQLYGVLDRQERHRLALLVSCMLLTGVIEVSGVAAVMPFMALVANPAQVDRISLLHWLKSVSGLGLYPFVMAMGGAVLALLLTTNAFIAGTTAFLIRFGFHLQHSFSSRLLASYLNRPYIYFLGEHSSRLHRNVTAEVHSLVTGLLNPCLLAISRMVSAACILLLLFWISPLPATILALLLGGAYVLVFRLVRRLLQQNGERAANAGRSLVKSVAEACGGIKEIKLAGLEREFVSRHADSSRALADCQATGSIVPMLPRYVLEVVAFGSVIALVVVLFGSDRSFSAIVPELTIFVVAGYRLMPALQAVFNGLAQVRYHQAALERVTHDLAGAPQPAPHAPGVAKLPLQQEIALNGVSFTYPAAGQPSLIDITLTIPARSTVALVGPSGSGKSTLADLVLGLLPPDKGEIAVDGLPLVGERMRSWQQSVGYVPQSVFLADDTVSRNIAFGLPAGQIDQAAVVQAARLANIHEFIEHELPEGYETLIGERGVRLSGGQRQRLGIARALYHNPQVLVLDEATNSLDGLAEEAIIEAIRLLARRVTVIMIAHRLATVRECDTIFLFDEGRLVDSGSFSDLVERNEQFQSLVQSSMGAAAATLSPTV